MKGLKVEVRVYSSNQPLMEEEEEDVNPPQYYEKKSSEPQAKEGLSQS